MIEYIMISYFIMFLLAVKWYMYDVIDGKYCIKTLLIAPITFPFWVIRFYEDL